MDEAVDVAALALGEVEGKAQGVGFAEACGPEGFVNRFAFEGEHAHGDGTNLVVPNGQKLALGIVNLHPFALLQAFGLQGYGSREHPRVKAAQTLGLAGVEADVLGVGIGCGNRRGRNALAAVGTAVMILGWHYFGSFSG